MASIHVEHGSPEWLTVRRQTIGSSESASLFGLGWQTPFQLGAAKSGLLEDDIGGDERVMLGQALEAAIATAAQQKFDVALRKVRRYITHPTIEGMGASLDYEELTDEHGWVPAEIKNVDYLIFRDEWAEDDEFGYLPPPKYLIQLQHQLACTGKPYGFFYVLVGGNTLHRIQIPRSDRLIASIETAVAQFWQRQRSGEPHPIDYVADRKALMRVFTDVKGKAEDRTGDVELAALVQQYAEVKKQLDAADEQLEKLKSQLFLRCKDFESVLAPGAKINVRLVEAQPERMVPYKASPARREMRVYLSKELKA
jgi:predicted phage-related endonuclease